MHVYPVVFSPLNEGGYCVYAPDFKGCITEAADYAEGITKIRDGLCGMLYILERDKLPIPVPSNVQHIDSDTGDIISLVDVPLDEYRRSISSKAVRRTISIPEWLDILATQSGLSLSQVTQEALKQKLSL
jgi:predicted RNase H-like HicB family nuclease